MEKCLHPVVMKDMCAQCGADLRREIELQSRLTCASVSMIHSVPELKVSEDQALILGQADKQRLLNERRLVLLVDLDQTLIHTTNDDINPRLQDIFHFQMSSGPTVRWYHTRVRPGTEDFLKRVSQKFELHICTFGSRYYAHMVACMIDPEKKYFSERILSRDECLDPNLKVANLSALFPCGDDLVCIIDDREDVWNFIPNMIHVKPYSFFRHTGDINAPNGPMGENVGQDPYDPLHQYETKFRPGVSIQKVKKDVEKVEEKSNDVQEIVSELLEKSIESLNDVDIAAEGTSEDNVIKTSEKNGDVASPEDDVLDDDYVLKAMDDDDYLMYLADILEHVHQAYYNILDQHRSAGINEIPHMNRVVPYVRGKVLKGCKIVFSGVIPIHMPAEKSRIFHVAKNLGAEIQDQVRIPKSKEDPFATTHVIAAKVGTVKVNDARRSSSVHIVTPDWLWSCNERWEKVTERLFPLISDIPIKPVKPKKSEDSRSKRRSNHHLKKSEKAGSPEKATPIVFEDFPIYDPRTGKRISNKPKEKSWSKPCIVEPIPVLRDDLSDPQPGCSKFGNCAKSEPFRVNPLMTFSAEDIQTMDEEVTGILHAEGVDSSSDEEDEDIRTRRIVLGKKRKCVSPASSHGDYSPADDSSSSSVEILDNDQPAHYGRMIKSEKYPGKFKRRKQTDKRTYCLLDEEENDSSENEDYPRFPRGALPRDEDQSENSRGSSEFNDSVGSYDEEMGAAIEKEFLGL